MPMDHEALAKSAVPTLRQIIDSERRLPEVATIHEWVDLDESLRAAAERALMRIEE